MEAKRLTVRMKEAKSAEEFVNVLEPAVDLPIFNYFHASASYHRLAMWKRMGKLPAGEDESFARPAQSPSERDGCRKQSKPPSMCQYPLERCTFIRCSNQSTRCCD